MVWGGGDLTHEEVYLRGKLLVGTYRVWSSFIRNRGPAIITFLLAKLGIDDFNVAARAISRRWNLSPKL